MASMALAKEVAPLLARQARRKRMDVSRLRNLYVQEKALEEEFPGVGFRDAAGGREAYVLGHRVAVWQVEDVHKETKSVKRTADYFRWPESLVKCALLFARQFPAEVEAQRKAETE